MTSPGTVKVTASRSIHRHHTSTASRSGTRLNNPLDVPDRAYNLLHNLARPVSNPFRANRIEEPGPLICFQRVALRQGPATVSNGTL